MSTILYVLRLDTVQMMQRTKSIKKLTHLGSGLYVKLCKHLYTICTFCDINSAKDVEN